MRVESWNPNRFDQEFENVAMDRLESAAEVIAGKARQKCPVGTISRPIYKRGPYAGQPWTARDAGQLKRSIRLTKKLTKHGKPLARKRSIRVYAGHYLAYYARIVEYGGRQFLRPALQSSMAQVKSIIGVR